jgi:hypothetical protein
MVALMLPDEGWVGGSGYRRDIYRFDIGIEDRMSQPDRAAAAEAMM